MIHAAAWTALALFAPTQEQGAQAPVKEADASATAGGEQEQASPYTLSDAGISAAVQEELDWDGVVPAGAVEAASADGIVTLAGSVDNLLAKERAARLATTVRGVRSVVNEIEIAPPEPKLKDQVVEQQVEQALADDPVSAGWALGVEVNQGRASLSGTLDTYLQEQLATRIASGVRGVREVVSDIRVEYEGEAEDAQIAAEVRDVLEWDVLVDQSALEVSVAEGAVRVVGRVGSGAEKARVARDVWKVPAVRAVDVTGVHVVEWSDDPQVVQATRATPPEEEVERALQRALMRHPRVSAFDVTPELSLGVVTLRGTVDNVAAARAALETARHTRGVVAVIDRLEVRPGVPADDEAVAERVRSALARDPYIDRADPLRVAVADGTVVLEGRVDSAFERAQAQDVASRVRGVAAVESRIQLEEGARRPLFDPFVDPTLLDENDWADERARPREAAAGDGADAEAGVDDDALRERVARQLWWSPFVDQSKVEVQARDGVVILTGTIGSPLQRRMATSEAFEAGADWVENRLEVSARGS